MSMTPAEVVASVSCPDCFSRMGTECWRWHRKPTKGAEGVQVDCYPHAERVKAAEAQQRREEAKG